jgi:hypothetical protein
VLFDRSDPAMFWLNMTNLGLGIVVGLCFLAVLYGVARDVLERVRARADRHTFYAPDLGVTMADGGEPEEPPRR